MFHNYMYQYIVTTQLHTAKQISNFFSDAFEQKINGTFSSLEVLANTIETKDDVHTMLKQIESDVRFETVGFVNTKGDLIDSKGKQKKVEGKDFYKKTMAGENYLSNVVGDQDNKKYFLFAVPVYNQSDIIGTLYAWCNANVFIEDLNFAKDSVYYFQIISSSGKYISKSQNENVLVGHGKDNFWDELSTYSIHKPTTINQLKDDFKQGGAGEFSITYQQNVRYVSYECLDINDWYILTVFTNEEINSILHRLNIYIIIISIIFIFVAAYMYRYFKKTSSIIESKSYELKTQNRLLNIVLENTLTIPFMLDIQKQKMTLFYHFNQYNTKDEIELMMDGHDFVKQGFIEEEYQDILDNFFENLKTDTKNKEVVLQFIINDKKRWMKMKIFDDYHNQNSLLGVVMDFMDEKMMDERLIHQEKEYLKLAQESMLDELTQVYSRKTIESKINDFLKKNNQLYHAFCIIDIDNFKNVNDKLGHVLGDQVLIDAAKYMQSHLRSDDYVGRLGGDEFICFIKNIKDKNDIVKIAIGLNECLRHAYSNNGQDIHTSASIGISVARENGDTFEQLYQYADLALYQTKRRGKNGYTIYNEE